MNIRDVDEALRLMRARPVADKAAGDLLRAASNMAEAVADVVPDEPLDELSHIFVLETKRHHWERVLECRDRLEKAIEAAERAGIGKNLPT